MEQNKSLGAVAVVLRLLQFASAVIVTGITAYFISESDTNTWNLGRFIYTELVAGITLLVFILSFLPSVDAFIRIPVDIALSLLWWSVFGLLFNFTQYPCGWIFEWMNIAPPFDQQCVRFNVSTAFALVAAVISMLSAVFNVLIERRGDGQADAHLRIKRLQPEMRQATDEGLV